VGGYHCSPPSPQLPSQPEVISTLRTEPNNTDWCERNVSGTRWLYNLVGELVVVLLCQVGHFLPHLSELSLKFFLLVNSGRCSLFFYKTDAQQNIKMSMHIRLTIQRSRVPDHHGRCLSRSGVQVLALRLWHYYS